MAVLLLLFPAAARAEVTVRLAPETASLFIYEPFTLRLEVDCESPPQSPELPPVPDLAVTTVRRLPSDPARRLHAFQIELISERDGVVTLPPFAVHADDESVLTPALRLRINSPRRATEMELAIAIEPPELHVGQPALVTVTWTCGVADRQATVDQGEAATVGSLHSTTGTRADRQVAFARCKQLVLELPLLADPRCRLFPLEPAVPDEQRIGLPVNNLRIVAQNGRLPDERAFLAFRFMLVPLEPCALRTEPARLVCALLDGAGEASQSPSYFYNHFFEAPADDEAYQRIYLDAAVPELTVRALPEAGRTACFADVVGSCELGVSVAPTQLLVGQPALFTVQLDNLVFARHLAALPSAALAGLRPEFQLSTEPIRETATDQARSWTYILRPLRPGIARIPAVVVQVFDPDSGVYRTLRSAPIPIRVEPNPDVNGPAVAPRLDAKPPIPLNGIRHNRVPEQTMIVVCDLLEFFGRYWWAWVPLPPLVWLALLPLARRWERCRQDPVYARAVSAWRRFRRAAPDDEERAWRQYLADRLALCAQALTADTVSQSLRARQVDESLIAETRRRMEDKDATDYGRRPAPPPGGTRNLVRRLERATVPLLLAVGLLVPCSAQAAESAEALFARALQLRGEKPDEAQPLFAEAALGFESAEQFLNAGNSWFFAGESGRALANYRAAERRSPFDRQLRESIAFLRANRADAWPVPAAPTGQMAAAWHRFCTWAAVLRRGIFVVAYLLAWSVFLAARLLGVRVRRVAWAGLVALVGLPLMSLAQASFQPAEAVVIEDSIARLGPGYAYDAAFKLPLHKAAEFAWLEARQGWVRARLPDGSEGWLRESDCMRVD